MHFLMTTDVESFSIPLNREDSDVVKQIYEVGLPHLLDLYAKHDIKCTFYFTGTMCELLPDSVGLVKAHGHEIGKRLPLINEFAAIIIVVCSMQR